MLMEGFFFVAEQELPTGVGWRVRQNTLPGAAAPDGLGLR